MEPFTLAVAIAGMFLGGLIKGAIGLGMPLVMISVLAIVMPLREALPLIAVSLIAANVWQIWATWRNRPGLRQLLSLMLPLMAAVWVASGFIAGGDPDLLNALVGLVVIGYVAVSWTRWEPRLPERLEPVVTPAVGAAAGAVGGVTGVFGPQLGVYLLALRMEPGAMVGLLGWTLLAGSTTLAAALAGRGLLVSAGDWAVSAAAFLPALAGLVAGGRLREAMPVGRFRTLVMAGLLVLGIANLRGLVT